MPVALWLTLETLIPVGEDRFPEGQEVYLLFNSDIANYYYLFKISEGETEGLILLFL